MIIKQAKEEFITQLKKGDPDEFEWLFDHVLELEKWTNFMFKKYKKQGEKLDLEILMLGVWLHDIGYSVHDCIDHATISYGIAKKFLESKKYPVDKMQRVLHCVRSHRCKDVMPETFESKLFACADSASHLTDKVYIKILHKEKDKNSKGTIALEKLERDYRDLKNFKEIQKELKPLYLTWKKLLTKIKAFDL